jgi:hypothetical protein
MPDIQLAFHGLLNSKPFGATGLSVCPLKKPVNRASLSITVIQLAMSHFSSLTPIAGACVRTLLVPDINAMSVFLAAVRDRLDHREATARNAKHLQHKHTSVSFSYMITCRQRAIAYH